jgi:branched-chain amino acid aminotransferase
MDTTVFSHNGELKPIAQAFVPLDDIAYSYGFGVYETIRINDGIPYFADQHLNRLIESARIIQLEHQFSKEFIRKSLQDLMSANSNATANAKLLLIGGKSETTANLYIQLLNPFFPDRKLYRDGAHVITYEFERLFPRAKTLNMMSSYMAYTEAKRAGAYDALLIDHDGTITEGTRTNIFLVRDGKLITPPDQHILLGVMRAVVLKVAAESGIDVVTEEVALTKLDRYDGLFLTSTSSKVMPVKSIDEFSFANVPELVTQLINRVDSFLDASHGVMTEN